MKLYAYQPKGHGEYSFFVMAETEQDAFRYIQVYIDKFCRDEDGSLSYESQSWGTDYYEVTSGIEGFVITNLND